MVDFKGIERGLLVFRWENEICYISVAMYCLPKRCTTKRVIAGT